MSRSFNARSKYVTFSPRSSERERERAERLRYDRLYRHGKTVSAVSDDALDREDSDD